MTMKAAAFADGWAANSSSATSIALSTSRSLTRYPGLRPRQELRLCL
ncbi:hypothetical protein ABN034_08035 [Actinopolymorpha sp. B11F2]